MKLMVDLNDEVYNNIVVKNEYTHEDIIAVHNALIGATHIPERHEDEDIAKAFQLGLAFGFGTKHDEMDRVINEIKKEEGKSVPWHLDVFRQAADMIEHATLKAERSEQK